MSAVLPLVNEGLNRKGQPGDLLLSQDSGQTLAASGTIVAATLATNLAVVTGAAGTSALPTAADLLAAITTGVPTGLGTDSTYRCRVVNIGAGTHGLTITANTGWAAAADADAIASVTLAAHTARDLLVRFKTTGPLSVIQYSGASGQAVATVLNPTVLASLQVGMIVTVAGTGVAQGVTITGINAAAGTITLSANISSTATNASITVSPTAQVGWA
jgi:hypothetical protein